VSLPLVCLSLSFSVPVAGEEPTPNNHDKGTELRAIFEQMCSRSWVGFPLLPSPSSFPRREKDNSRDERGDRALFDHFSLSDH